MVRRGATYDQDTDQLQDILRQRQTLNLVDSGEMEGAAIAAAYVAFADPEQAQVSGGHVDWFGGSPMFEWAPHGSGAAIHLVPGAAFTGPYAFGIGADHDTSKGLIISIKQGGLGEAINVEKTSKAAARGLFVQVLGAGRGVVMSHATVAGDNGALGTLLTLQGHTAAGDNRILSVQNTAGQEAGYFDSAGRFWLRSASANDHSVGWNFGSGPSQRFYTFMGTDAYHASYIDTLTSESRLRIRQSRATAAKGSESLTTMMEFVRGKHVSFFGRSVDATSGGDLTIAIPNATAAPTAAPAAGGGILYVNNGDLRWLNPAGHTIALTRQSPIADVDAGATLVEVITAVNAILNRFRPGQIGLIPES